MIGKPKLKHMKKTFISAFLFLITFQIVFSQQFNFSELIEISKSQKQFEQRMYGIGNDLLDIENQGQIYSYYTNSGGGYGSSTAIPTKDPKMETRFRLSNGDTLTASQVDRQFNQDERNNLISSRKMILVKGPENKYHYTPDLNTFEISNSTISKFAENYNRTKKVASTFYSHNSRKRILNEGKGPILYDNRLSIQFNNDSDYKNILKQIQSNAKYIKTEKILFLQIEFTYKDPILKNECKITCYPNIENQGRSSTIDFTWDDLSSASVDL